MYLNHYGLKSKPFQLAHDPAFYYAAAHQIPLNELCYSIEERHGLATLVGEPGTGKTTLLRRLLQSFGPHQRGIFMSETSLDGVTLLRRLATALGISGASNENSLPDFVWKLLQRQAQAGKTLVLLIDEAQGISAHQFEEIRYLTNMEASGRKLLEIIMAGQPSLEKRLAVPAVAALKQRVAVRCRLEPLDLEHTGNYIEHRLQVAGAPNQSLFKADATALIHEKSGGVPRLINIISDRCLLVGYAEDSRSIERVTVVEAVADLRMPDPGANEPEDPTSVTAGDSRLLMRMGSRVDVIEQKLDLLLQMLVRGGIIRPELSDEPRKQRWLEWLGRVGPAARHPREAANRPDDSEATAQISVNKPGGPRSGGEG